MWMSEIAVRDVGQDIYVVVDVSMNQLLLTEILNLSLPYVIYLS